MPVDYLYSKVVPCLELEISQLLSMKILDLPELQNGTLAAMIATFITLYFLVSYNAAFHRSTFTINEYYRLARLKIMFWKRQRKLEKLAGLHEMHWSERPLKFAYPTEPYKSKENELHRYMDVQSRLTVLNFRERAHIPTLIHFKRSRWWLIVAFGFLYSFIIVCICATHQLFRFHSPPAGSYAWLCKTTHAICKHIEYRAELTEARCPNFNTECFTEMCVIDLNAEKLLAGQFNASAMIFDQAHHNVHRMYYNERTPSLVSSTMVLVVAILTGNSLWILLLRADNGINVIDRAGYFISRGHFITFRNMILLGGVYQLAIFIYVMTLIGKDAVDICELNLDVEVSASNETIYKILEHHLEKLLAPK